MTTDTNKNTTMLKTTHWLLGAFLIVTLDQLSKYALVDVFGFQLGDVKPVSSYFNLVRAHNPGAAFSFLADAGGWQRWFFTAIAMVAVVVLVWMLRKSQQLPAMYNAALSLVLGGAVGNLIDRVRWGYVVDFLDFYWQHHHFAAFNVADAAITLGAFLLILDAFRHQQSHS